GRRDLGDRYPHPVLIVGRAGHAQQLAVGRPDGRGERYASRQPCVRPEAEPDARTRDGKTCEQGRRQEPTPPPGFHGLTISSVPAGLTPVIVRSYIPSAKAGGILKGPAFVARTR